MAHLQLALCGLEARDGQRGGGLRTILLCRLPRCFDLIAFGGRGYLGGRFVVIWGSGE